MSSSSLRSSTPADALPVSIRELSRRFGDRAVLNELSLEIAAGEIVALIGPSGCGKSTLLRHIGGLDSPTGGSIGIGGVPVTGLDARSAIAFQEPRLLPWRSITRNVEVGLPRGKRTSADRDRVAELLELVKLSSSAHLRPREISGGMAQRVSLARALARRPGVLLLDEPFGALDALTRLSMQDLLLDLHAAEPATIVIVTHDVDEALYLADRVILLGAIDPTESAAHASIRSTVVVPGLRPRDRGSGDLAELRAELLEGLGVPTHHLSAR
ncbi:ABC transporter ATP-binding protein [Salinibacterium sp. NK8237]|uniref:ABC transporter ATP-binding protein n=1 Tax=Salinibacterium sp. NK8237 TaxID=2792038 RepID=UPI0018CC8F62|nr:ABC transporter ATP-binding protein [Salinibacterium sp. NK8237]MBH0129074.1 ABC transporter ATP-binding protein [Salinibacterium sp. NK8237]